MIPLGGAYARSGTRKSSSCDSSWAGTGRSASSRCRARIFRCSSRFTGAAGSDLTRSSASEQIFQTMRELNRDLGVTIIVVTHDINVSTRVDRVIGMRDGRTSIEILRLTSRSRPDSKRVRVRG